MILMFFKIGSRFGVWFSDVFVFLIIVFMIVMILVFFLVEVIVFLVVFFVMVKIVFLIGFMIVLYVIFIFVWSAVVNFWVFIFFLFLMFFVKFLNNWDKIIFEFFFVFISRFFDRVMLILLMLGELRCFIFFVFDDIDKFMFVLVLLFGMGNIFSVFIVDVF